MKKHVMFCLAGCLALSVAFGASAQQQDATELSARFDGTYCELSALFSSHDPDVAIVDAVYLNPDVQSEPDAQAALATGRRLAGVDAQANLIFGDEVSPKRPVYRDVQEGAAVRKTFLFVITPEDDAATLSARLISWDADLEGRLEDTRRTANWQIERDAPARTADFAPDAAVDSLGMHISRVFISHAQGRLAVMLRHERAVESIGDATLHAPGGTAVPAAFLTHEPSPDEAFAWTTFTFEGISALPDSLTLELTRTYPSMGEPAVTLMLDLLEEAVRVL